jgi:hypothetical protein
MFYSRLLSFFGISSKKNKSVDKSISDQKKTTTSNMALDFDYIIVGGGTAGI